MENKQAIAELFNAYLSGETSQEETTYLLSYFGSEEGSKYLNELVNARFDEGVEVDAVLLARLHPLTDRVALKLNSFIKESSRNKPIWKLVTRVAVAASIVLAIGAFLIYNNSNNDFTPGKVVIDADPGDNRAMLTLEDGSQINLNEAANGKLAEQAGVQISKTADGQLVYAAIAPAKTSESFNTIATPKGGQYKIRLPDGSKVWLNASSSLKYPVSFAKLQERRVELVGEAYFEITPDAAQLFHVATGTQTVEVLGTHFNVNSYTDEKHVVTTLAEGSVRVRSKGQQRLIIPGQQTLLSKEGTFIIQPADIETALSWKDGNLVFKSATIEEIMRQVQRWYNVEVVYQGKVSKRVFSGGLSRSSKLSVLLNVLKDSDINFELKETRQVKTLLIKP